MSRCRQNYDTECEAGINRQINMELYAMYTYTSLVSIARARKGGDKDLRVVSTVNCVFDSFQVDCTLNSSRSFTVYRASTLSVTTWI